MAAPVWATNDVPSATDFNTWIQNIRWARRTTAASVTSSTTLVSDSTLTLPVDAGAVYHLDMVLLYDGASAADLKAQIIVPASAVGTGFANGLIAAAAAQSDDQIYVWSDTTTYIFGITSTNAARFEGVIVTGGTAGNVTLQWAQNASSATPTRILTNSYMRLWRVE